MTRRAVEQAVLGSFVLVGCLVAGVDIDPSLSADESGEIISGSGGVSGQGPTGGTGKGGTPSRGGASGQGGSERGGEGPVGGTDSGGSDPGGSDAGGMDAGGSDAGGMDAGGADSGGTDSGGTDTGGVGMGGTALAGAGVGGTPGGAGTGGAGAGGAGVGGAGVGGTAGAGGSAGSAGGGTGGLGCASIVPGMPCPNEGTCVQAPCGFGSVGRFTCSCPSASSEWSCSACSYAGTPFETQPMISLCYPNTTDGVQCSIPQQVCGPVANEYCVCQNPSGTSAAWDCSPPPAHWGCTGLHVSMTLTGGSTAHDHLPLTEGEQAAITANIRSAFATSGMTLPVEMGHSHNIPLQPVHVTTLRNGGVATDLVTDTVDGHFHVYSLMCLP